jgi:hypothetical protein
MPPIAPPTMAPIDVEDALCELIVGNVDEELLGLEVGVVLAFWVAPGGRRTVAVPLAKEGC